MQLGEERDYMQRWERGVVWEFGTKMSRSRFRDHDENPGNKGARKYTPTLMAFEYRYSRQKRLYYHYCFIFWLIIIILFWAAKIVYFFYLKFSLLNILFIFIWGPMLNSLFSVYDASWFFFSSDLSLWDWVKLRQLSVCVWDKWNWVKFEKKKLQKRASVFKLLIERVRENKVVFPFLSLILHDFLLLFFFSDSRHLMCYHD